MRIAHLDGFRGILAITVVISHGFGIYGGWQPDRPFAGGSIAVLDFFVLSGFVLSYYLERHPDPILDFFITRFLRLWPVTASCAVVAILQICVARRFGGYAPAIDFTNWKTLAANFAMVERLWTDSIPQINGPAWSISVELWTSAIVVPLLLRAPMLLPPLAAFISLLILLPTHRIVDTGMGMVAFGYFSGNLISAVFGMSLGVILFRIQFLSGTFKDIIPYRLGARTLSFLLLLHLFCLYWRQSIGFEFLGLATFLPFLFISNFRIQSGFLVNLLESRFVLWLGKVSFSLYLVHMPIELLLLPAFNFFNSTVTESVIVALLAALISAWLVHSVVEMPVSRLFIAIRRKEISQHKRRVART